MIDEVQDYTQAQLMALSAFFGNAHFLLLGDENQAIIEGTATFPEIRELFEQSHGGVDECALQTSYRSSPEVTALFTGLMPEDERGQASSVQREGEKPLVQAFEDEEAWRGALSEAVEQALRRDDLTAIVAADGEQLYRLQGWLPQAFPQIKVLKDDDVLPGRGVVLLDVALAKGLEFDTVIVPDASAEEYPNVPLQRRRLYTALSRATHRVDVLARGSLTPLLAQE